MTIKTASAILALAAVLAWPAPVSPARIKEQNLRVEYYALLAMPVQVNTLRVRNRTVLTKLEYSITNLSKDYLERMQIKLYVFNSKGECERVEELTDNIQLEAQMSKTSSIDLINNYEPDAHLILVIQELVGKSGRWFVESEKLDSAIKSKLTNYMDVPLEVKHEVDLVLTDADKAEIFSTTLKGVLKDESIASLFSSSENLNVSTENLPVNLRIKIPDVDLLFLNPLEIQTRANQHGEIRYIKIEPFAIEGSKVIETLNVYQKVRNNQVFTPCCGSFIFEYYKDANSGKWIVKEIRNYKV